MAVATPLREQAPVPLPEEEPLLNLQFGPSFSLKRVPDVRHFLTGFLETEKVQGSVGRPIPASVLELAAQLITEGLSNAHRPAIGRVATSVLVWGSEGRLDIAVGDNSDEIDSADGRKKTLELPSDENGDAPAFDVDAILAELEESGLGQLMMARGADEVFWSRVTAGQAAGIEEPRTHKVVHNVVYV